MSARSILMFGWRSGGDRAPWFSPTGPRPPIRIGTLPLPNQDPSGLLEGSSGGYCSVVSAVITTPSCHHGNTARGKLAGLRFCLVGAGKVGSSLAHWLVEHGAALARVGARRPEAVQPWAESLGGQAVAIDELGEPSERESPSELLLIAVSDPAIEEVARQLSRCRPSPRARVALHTSGSQGADALSALADSMEIGSLHPLKAFARILPQASEAAGTLFAIDGGPAATALARRLARVWGGSTAEVPTAARPLYHFAASLAAGGVVTLLATADRIAQQQGLDPIVTQGYLDLAIGALRAARDAAAPSAAITGPLARHDWATAARQLELLAKADPEALPLCGQLAMETLRHLGLPAARRREAAARLGLSRKGAKDDMNGQSSEAMGDVESDRENL